MAYAERAFHDAWVPSWVRHQTIQRYAWAASFVSGRKVLEVACGTGDGTAILKETAASVDGYDVAADAVAEARRRHEAPGVRFVQGDGQKLPVDDAAYDVYVSFETIEHVPDDRAFVAEARRVLKPDGLFLCSTPNRSVTNAGKGIGDKPFNPFHLREYSRGELHALLSASFASVELHGQSPYSSSYVGLLNRVGQRFPAVSVRAHQLRKLLTSPWDSAERHAPIPEVSGKEAEILVAICR